MRDRADIRAAYDDIAPAYADERSASSQDMDVLEAFLDTLPAGGVVLDAGCGQGVPILQRVQSSRASMGLDFSREQLELARATVSAVPLIQADVTTLPLRDDVLTAITAFHTLIHIPRSAQPAVIGEFARILSPGGRVLVTDGPEEWTGSNPDWLGTGVEMEWHISGAATTKTHLRNAGFQIEREWELTTDEHWVYLQAKLASGLR